MEGNQQADQAQRAFSVKYVRSSAMSLRSVRRELETLACSWVPRLLTHLDRDPTSSTFGCADRDWWHYKIRDFPSIILQQAGYTAWLATVLPNFRSCASGLKQLAAASAFFWAERAKRRGAFEEYYPNEQGYPPLAFSTLAMSKLVFDGAVPSQQLRAGFAVAAAQLTSRFEAEATNQQVAGLAALHFISKIYPDLVSKAKLEQIVERTLALQNTEGWYQEYGGPDIGYLSVTMDCLWDAYDASNDRKYLISVRKALDYLHDIVQIAGSNIGVHCSRNTEYVMPYGIARFCRYHDAWRDKALNLIEVLFSRINTPDHFLNAIDDRYVCHYIGHSLLRALGELKGQTISRIAATPEAMDSENELYFTQSGLFVRKFAQGPTILISLKKGGTLTLRTNDGSSASDFGIAVPISGGRAVSHWWSDGWSAERLGNGWLVRGRLIPCQEHLSKTWKHAVLRIASQLVGRHLKRALKQFLILNPRRGKWQFERKIVWQGDRILVKDSIRGLPPEKTPQAAPRTSRRYVPSANHYHVEDFCLVRPPWQVEQTTSRSDDVWETEKTYSLRGS